MTSSSSELPPLIGQSRPILEFMEQLSQVAPLDRPVLVIGERGTGKELIAARLHFLSRRWDQPFVKINCAALAETLLETELFGHEAGAFTGAARRHSGRFEIAHGGSLFLDEIANASLRTQEKVLRVIEYGEFERVGGTDTLTVDVRLIAATHRDLPEEAQAGRFRHDLLDRLAFEVLTVPPLRARQEDIPLLAEHFGRAMSRELNWESFPGFASAATEALLDYSWPGNVRELKNVVERAIYRAPTPDEPIVGLIFDPFDSPYRSQHRVPSQQEPMSPPGQSAKKIESIDAAKPLDFRTTVAELERRILEQALEANQYNQRAAAAHLNLTYDQLRHQLKKHNLLSDRRHTPS